MAVFACSLLTIFLLISAIHPLEQRMDLASASPYLSATVFPTNYLRMSENFRIFVYEARENRTFSSPVEALFHDYLLRSPFLTSDPALAHLFYLSLPSPSPRSIARSIRALRYDFPFWNLTLGADHFFVSCAGIGVESDRNLVELRKNSILISCFPAAEGRFIPHKDVTLPPVSTYLPSPTRSDKFLGFLRVEEEDKSSAVVNDLSQDPDFLVESEPLEAESYAERLSSSRYCLFLYGSGAGWAIGEALRLGCVPVVVADRPIVDLPFSDVLRWTDIAVVVRPRYGREVKRVLGEVTRERYESMQEAGKTASVHFRWEEGYEYGAFYTVLYQLWTRRHTIRYTRWQLKG